MKRLAAGLAVALVVGCTPSTAPTLTTAPPGATSTSIAGDTCDGLVGDTARYLELVVQVLDATAIDDFRDRDRWPESLLALEEQGRDLDARAEAMACDPALVQSRALAEARLRPSTGLSEFLVGIYHPDE